MRTWSDQAQQVTELVRKPACRRVRVYKRNELSRSTHTSLREWPHKAFRWQYASCRKGCVESHTSRTSICQRAGAGLCAPAKARTCLKRGVGGYRRTKAPSPRLSLENRRQGVLRRPCPKCPYHLNDVSAPCPLYVQSCQGNVALRAARAPRLFQTGNRSLTCQTKRAVGVRPWNRCGKLNCIEQWITCRRTLWNMCNQNRPQRCGLSYDRTKSYE